MQRVPVEKCGSSLSLVVNNSSVLPYHKYEAMFVRF